MKIWIAISMLSISSGLYSQRILYSELNNDNWDIYSTSIEGATIRITKNSLKDFQSDYAKAKNLIVFDSYRDRNTRNIFTIDVSSGEIIQLTNLATRDGHPAWSPEGSKIAFQSSRTGNPEVFVMDSNGENVEQLTFEDGFDGIPKWSPDGKGLAFNSNRDGHPNVFLLNLQTKNLVQITSDESYNFIQDWISQTEILIITDVSSKRQLQIVDIQHGGLAKTIPTSGDVTYARCNNDGEIIFTQKTVSGDFEVFLTSVQSNSTRQITDSKNEKRFPAFMD